MPDRRPDTEIELNDEIERLGRENKRLRGELDELRTEQQHYDALTPQQCQNGAHGEWFIDSEHAYRCPWCALDEARAAIERVRELHKPCSVCLAGHCHRCSVPYPCATARALDTADREVSGDE